MKTNILIVVIQNDDDTSARLEYQLNDFGFDKVIQYDSKDSYFRSVKQNIGPHIVINNVNSLNFDLNIFTKLAYFKEDSVLVSYSEDLVANGYWPDENSILQNISEVENIIDCYISEDIYYYHNVPHKALISRGLRAVPISLKNEYVPSDLYRPALFLDRDGIINVDKEYLYKIEDLEIYENCISLIKYFNMKNYPVCVVTNQSGIAREKYTEEDVVKLHNHMSKELAKNGAKIDEWYISPYHKVGNNNEYDKISLLRKPYPAMLLQAARDYPIRMENSFMIGDKASDFINLEKQGLITYHIKRQYDLADAKGVICKDLLDALQKIKLVLEQKT